MSSHEANDSNDHYIFHPNSKLLSEYRYNKNYETQLSTVGSSVNMSDILPEYRPKKHSLSHNIKQIVDGSDNNDNSYSKTKRPVKWATRLSLLANILLFLIKSFIFIWTGSLAVVASLIDSALDLVSQIIMFYTEKNVSKGKTEKYPVGTTRLEPIGIFLVSNLMIMLSVLVIQQSVTTLISSNYDIAFGLYTAIIPLAGAIFMKFLLFLYCRRWSNSNPIAHALAEDHKNDVLSNSMALVAGIIAVDVNNAGYVDPGGAIIISLYIIWSWYGIGKEEIQKILGKQADEDMLNQVRKVINKHHKDVTLDILRGYHAGRNILVEVEVIMPKEYNLIQVHDISLDLQNKIEVFDFVERAFVHVDYMARDYDEHKVPTLE